MHFYPSALKFGFDSSGPVLYSWHLIMIKQSSAVSPLGPSSVGSPISTPPDFSCASSPALLLMSIFKAQLCYSQGLVSLPAPDSFVELSFPFHPLRSPDSFSQKQTDVFLLWEEF